MPPLNLNGTHIRVAASARGTEDVVHLPLGATIEGALNLCNSALVLAVKIKLSKRPGSE
jgi:hypothetical protein